MDRNKIPEFVKIIYREAYYLKSRAKGKLLKMLVKISPELHARYEMKREKQELLRPVNLKNPKYFHEKRMWLKYYIYNNSKVVAKCYNKYYVRDYIKSKGLDYILNDLYYVWDSIDEIKWDELPDECVIKVANGCQGHVFKKKNQEFDISEARKTLKQTIKRSKYFFEITGDLFCYGTKQKIICEKMIHSNIGKEAPEDFKFHCFNGEPKYLEYISDRIGHNVESHVVDMELKDHHELEGESAPGDIIEPPCFNEMKEIARILSKDFPYVRVDLYVEKNRVIFGELTFSPYHHETDLSQPVLGELLDISRFLKNSNEF